MPAQIAVIDNDSLNFLTKTERSIPIFPILRSLFRGLYVPEEVKTEFERNMPQDAAHQRVLSQIRLSNSFLKLCSTYDIFSKILLEGVKDIDPGEAEAFAQYKKIQAHFIISDDRKFASAVRLQDPTVRIIDTVLLFAWLDQLALLSNPKAHLRALFQQRRFTPQQLRNAYKQAAGMLGKKFSNRELQRKTNFKLLGIKVQ